MASGAADMVSATASINRRSHQRLSVNRRGVYNDPGQDWRSGAAVAVRRQPHHT
jgi:hypothetical protein